VAPDFAPDVEILPDLKSSARAAFPGLRDADMAMRLIRLAIVISMFNLTR
jgi:hypothetical protein